MVERPTVDRLDLVAVLAAVSALVFAYGLVSDAIVRYTAWLLVFTIWMAWFIYFGTKWMYDIEA
ncbi:hypothetical protein [Halovenus marina]|uniref:hypothetical protein n=1 Tax=Halovenus marina TaxID=3396621 RepID=UPI003F55A5B8